MEKIIKDAEMASRVVEGEEFFYHDKIYYSSNENLEELFKYIDVKDKDVLTVLASSDQYFYSCINGARSVDTFDKNILTKYYYYLRKWSIKYLGSIYPDKKLINNSRYIYELLELVECSSRDEELAKLFWNSYIRRIYPFDNNKLFFIGTRKHNLDKDTISEIVDKDLVFFHEDLKGRINKSKKYDVIMISNILEYCDTESLEKIRNNLNDILNDNGIVVCSDIMGDASLVAQIQVFLKNSMYHELPKYVDEEMFDFKFPLGYVYTKKDVNKK